MLVQFEVYPQSKYIVMTSKNSKSGNTNKAEREELLAIKLLYCMDSRSSAEQRRIYDTIKDSLKTAISHVILTVETILRQKGFFKGSASLNDDNLLALVIERTDIQILKNFFHRFYEEGIEKLDMKQIIAFYNCISENTQKIRSKEIMIVRYTDLEKGTIGQTAQTKKEQSFEEKDHTNHEVHVKNEPQFQQTESPLQQNESLPPQTEQGSEDEIQIIQEKSIKKIELSETSKDFIKLFSEGLPKKGKGRSLKKYRIDCLQHGEPTQYHQFYDSLIEGNATVIFTSPK